MDKPPSINVHSREHFYNRLEQASKLQKPYVKGKEVPIYMLPGSGKDVQGQKDTNIDLGTINSLAKDNLSTTSTPASKLKGLFSWLRSLTSTTAKVAQVANKTELESEKIQTTTQDQPIFATAGAGLADLNIIDDYIPTTISENIAKEKSNLKEQVRNLKSQISGFKNKVENSILNPETYNETVYQSHLKEKEVLLKSLEALPKKSMEPPQEGVDTKVLNKLKKSIEAIKPRAPLTADQIEAQKKLKPLWEEAINFNNKYWSAEAKDRLDLLLTEKKALLERYNGLIGKEGVKGDIKVIDPYDLGDFLKNIGVTDEVLEDYISTNRDDQSVLPEEKLEALRQQGIDYRLGL